jgi:ribonuclease R
MNKINLIGEIKILKNGYGFVLIKNYQQEVFIPKHNTATSLNHDIVKIKLNTDDKYTGKVIEVVKRSNQLIIGILKIKKYHNITCFISSPKIHTYIEIPYNKIKNAKHNDKVTVKVTKWEKYMQYPVGKIIQIIGQIGQYCTEYRSILLEHNIKNNFSQKVLKEAKHIISKISKQEIIKRKDMRHILTFTIDPEIAQDFDDAISFEKTENNYKIGVHISDVSHYVKENSEIDKEAYKRSNSIYFINKVIPMLPHILSDNLCSLNENEDKLAFSIIFTIDKHNKLLEYWIGETIIKSNKRFTYNEVEEIINNKTGLFKNEILKIYKITEMLKKERIKNGSILFESSELIFQMNKNNTPIGINIKQSNNAQSMIEELMLLTNKKICETCETNNKIATHLYRIHDKPNKDKLLLLYNFIKTLGYQLPKQKNIKLNTYLNSILKLTKNKPEKDIINTLMLRSMSKACYSTKNIGHYGLSFKYYTHFTSPIRRYADIIVHRLLKNTILNKKNKLTPCNIKEKDAKYFSKQEKISVDAERDFVKFLQIKYLESYIGQRFKGIISGITEWALYIELVHIKTDGIVRIKNIKNDTYIMDNEKYYIKGKKHGMIYKLGTKVIVKIKSINIEKKQINLELL